MNTAASRATAAAGAAKRGAQPAPPGSPPPSPLPPSPQPPSPPPSPISPRCAIGIGCGRGTAAASIAEAVATALALAGIDADAVACLASSARKSDEASLHEFAAARGWPLVFFAADELAGIAVPNPSQHALQHAGSASVAEAAARLAAGGGDLILAKQKSRAADGQHVTVAIARLASASEPTRAPALPPGAACCTLEKSR